MGANHAPGGGRAPARHLFALPPCCLVGGRGGFGRPPAPAFSFLFRPHPPSPLPLRGRGRPGLFHARGFAPCIPATEPARHWLDLPIQYPAGVCLLCHLLTLPLVYFLAPHPPCPLPLRGRGRFLVYFAGGFAPGTPAFNRLRHLQSLPSKYPAGGFRQFGAKPSEPPFYWQCRQPRRGGTGGDGTIRRKRRRRLRWSSPPGQGEPVPRGFCPRGARLAVAVGVANGLMQGCRGRSPRRNKL